MAELYVGIDLGTTNSTVSVIHTSDRRLRNPIDHLRTIPIIQCDENCDEIRDRETLPSYFFCKPEKKQIYTGEFAKRMYSKGNMPMNSFTGVKTRLGGESEVAIPGTDGSEIKLDMTQCSAILLKSIKNSIDEQFNNMEINHLVVTIPAAFNSDERQATRDAIEMAGFNNYHLLDEPAATLLYFINDGDGSLLENSVELNGKHIMIYDIGGGTLDICIAKLEEDEESYEFENMKVCIESRSKREDLGGNDFDQYLGAYFLSEFEKATEKLEMRSAEDQNRIISRIVSKAEEYKIFLNDKIREYSDNPRKAGKPIPVYFELIDNQNVMDSLDKSTLEEVYSGLLKDTQKRNILRPVKESIAATEGLNKDDISLVILTGGMSNFYAVEEVLKEYFGGNTGVITVDTTTSVSKGAAIDAYNHSPDNVSLKKMDLQDRMAENIYIRKNNGFELLISKDEISRSKKGEFQYTFQESNLPRIPIYLYYGADLNYPEDFTPITGKMVELPRPYEKGETVTVTWEIDPNGVIVISIEEFADKIKVDQSKSSEFKAKKALVDSLTINKVGEN